GYIGHDCISLVVAVIDLPAGSAPPPGNHAPTVTGVPEVTVHSPNPIVINAQAGDEDGDPLSFRIALDGVEVQSGTIPAGTPTSATLSLTNAFTLGQHTVIFTVSDGSSSANFTTVVNVTDITPPVLTLPANIIVPADPGKNTAVVTYAVSVTDDFPNPVVVSLPPSGSAFPI